MRYLSRLLLPLLLLLFSGAPALAQTAGWTISEAKGSVLVIDSRGERAASVGLAITPGATVRTKAQSSAVLVRGREFVTLRQNAQIRIPQVTSEKSIIQIIQDYGSALFKIGKQADPHFGVETPYLAAVVKGTTFIIAVGADGATLQVTEGAVEASTPDGGARELILPGAVAMVAAGDTMRLVIEGEGRKVIDSPARPASGPAAAPAPDVSSPATGAASAQGANRVDAAVVSSPSDVRNYTGGFASGEVAVLAGVVVADNSVRGAAPPFNTDGDGIGNGNGNGTPPAEPGNGGGTPPEEPGNGNGNGDVPAPPVDVPAPPVDVPGPPADVGPPADAGPPDGIPGAPDNIPGPPDNGPGPPDGVPGPPVDVGPPIDVGPPDDLPEPPGGDDDVGDDGDDGGDDDDGGNGNGNGNNGNGNGNGGGNGTGDEGSGNDDGGTGNGGDNDARINFRVGLYADGIDAGLSARDVMADPSGRDLLIQP